ncbi:twin-arginine translocase subunit TatC [Polluticaenibacter yanchengensis]|uniref:Sec-independent protein translocase protein TatC n=1 Tax=Polluticaenibacter yanchengensis TaxID=3014562 RepID=A0ABT4UIB5_9BACT|nr:twin-arginine translocase subunit TatC [Chitinophagaceae bacterium LY-5]
MALNELIDRRNKNNATGEMSMIDHLEALRWHVVRAVIAIVICGIACFIFIDPLMDYVIFGPLNKGFVTYDWLCALSQKILNSDTLCLPPPDVQMQTTTFGGQFISSITIAFVSGFIIAFPYVLWELWKFIKPALTRDEIKNTRGAVAFVTFFFLLGVAFGFFLMAPFTFSFLSNYKVGTMHLIETKPVLNDYIDNLVDITVGCGLAFQLPVISYVLTRMGLITPSFLKDYRKYAYVALLVIAAVITPSPDWMSQMIVVLPLILLYEFSIFIARRATKKTEEKEREEWS